MLSDLCHLSTSAVSQHIYIMFIIFCCLLIPLLFLYHTFLCQHVLEHGKSHERTAIISKLAGQIVKMSQQKYASNVIEKCLSFGTPEERQILVNEMLGTTDENEPLQVWPFSSLLVQNFIFPRLEITYYSFFFSCY